MSEDWVWFTCCYTSEKQYPYGFCRACWIAAGRPQPMGGGFVDDEE